VKAVTLRTSNKSTADQLFSKGFVGATKPRGLLSARDTQGPSSDDLVPF